MDFERGTVSINKSRNMGALGATKTANSERTIEIDQGLIEILKLLPSRELGIGLRVRSRSMKAQRFTRLRLASQYATYKLASGRLHPLTVSQAPRAANSGIRQHFANDVWQY